MSNTKINAATPEDAAYIQHLIEEAFAQKDWRYAKHLSMLIAFCGVVMCTTLI